MRSLTADHTFHQTPEGALPVWRRVGHYRRIYDGIQWGQHLAADLSTTCAFLSFDAQVFSLSCQEM